MNYVASTAEIVASKMLNRDINDIWVNWAIEMIQAGYESENIIILAGESKPFNQFELQRLTDKIFTELRLTTSNKETVFKNYVCYLIHEVNNHRMTYNEVLKILRDLYIGEDYNSYLIDFALLYWAKEDLGFFDISSYWPDADRENIDLIISNYFTKWHVENCADKR